VRTTMIGAALTAHPRSGPPAPVTAAQRVQRVAVAGADPTDSGRPLRHWTPREVADAVRQRGMGETISPRRVGRF
jgi:putative transposase